MAIFEPIVLAWNGRDYTIPPDQVMRAIAKVEDVFTMAQLNGHMQRADIPLAKLACAYAAVLRHAGARVTDEEVYDGMFSGGATALQTRALAAMSALLVMMIPPAHLRQKVEEKTAQGKAEAGATDPLSSRPSSSQ